MMESDQRSFRESAKKIRLQEKILVGQDNSIGYRILNFITVFAAISNYVKCKDCGGDIKFQTTDTRGLGFKIVLKCDKCEPRSIPSCSFIGHAYEINRRFIFAMRVLGIGLRGCEKFCGLMDVPLFFSRSTYDAILCNILDCVQEVSNKLLKKTVDEEKELIGERENIENPTELTVSGDGTWKKPDLASSLGVSSIIGYCTGKILDFVVKGSFCAPCEEWIMEHDTAAYEEWLESHSKSCHNPKGSSGKMEIEAIIEMCQRSQEKYGVKYTNYIDDGDSKTYSGVANSAPYGDNISIKNVQCVGDLEKKIRSRLRALKQKNSRLGGEDLPTGRMIDSLTMDYSSAIQRNRDSVVKMRIAIWAAYFHHSSNHTNCPIGTESWCSWQRASAKYDFSYYRPKFKPLPTNIQDDIKLIFKDFSGPELLERCVSGFNRRNNKGYNQLIWTISPPVNLCQYKILRLAANISACVFNDGCETLLQMFEAMGVHSGPNAHRYVTTQDAMRNERELCAEASTPTIAKTALYDIGFDDSV